VTKNRKLRVLCLDIEGGHGGSSRSLFNSLSYLDRNKVNVDVWCRKKSAIKDRYRSIGISVDTISGMPKTSSLPRMSRNLFFLAVFFFYDWPRSRGFRKKLSKESVRYDLIHCNHESLYWLARWIKRNIGVPITIHKRTNLWPTIFASFQVKIISKYVSGIVFITENEKDNFQKLGGNVLHSEVIYNIVPVVKKSPLALKSIPSDHRFKVCSLANYSYLRGIDQLVDVALNLQAIETERFLFVIAGDISLSKSLPGQLGSIAKAGGNLADYVCAMGVEKMFLFLGHTSEPERVLSACNILIRPSRECNPWGRDILEALSFGLPVIATGTYNNFVESKVTGFLMNEFDPKKVADCIVELFQNEQLVKHMGEQGKKRVQELCNGPDRARDLQNFWQKIVEQ
jgi:glycosyltransferase involved in cell wall biosynthesis